MKRILGCILVCALMGGLLAYPAFAAGPFPDVDEAAAYAEAVGVLQNMGIMQGEPDGNFHPSNKVTRAQMAAIICRVLGEEHDLTFNGTQFLDVPETHWANSYVARVASLGIVNGYGDGSFGPEDTVTYAQALTMIVRTMGLEENAVMAGGYPDGYIKVAVENGLAGEFSADQNELLTRWQVAEIVFGVFQ